MISNRLPQNKLDKRNIHYQKTSSENCTGGRITWERNSQHFKKNSILCNNRCGRQRWGATIDSRHLSGYWSQDAPKRALSPLQSSDYQGTRTKEHISNVTDTQQDLRRVYHEAGPHKIEKTFFSMSFTIFELLDKFNIHLTARYLPGRYNDIADSLSRFDQLPEWHLHREIIQVISRTFGTPQVNLFATRNSAVAKTCVQRCSGCLQQTVELQTRLRVSTSGTSFTCSTSPRP